MVARIGKRGTVVIPSMLRKRYHLTEGTLVSLEAAGDGLLLRAIAVGPSQEERERFFAALDEHVAATRADTKAWADEESERTALSGTLLDGLRDTNDA